MSRFEMQCSTVAFATKKTPAGQMLKSCVPKGDPFDQEVTALFEELIEEYLDGDIEEQSLAALDNKSSASTSSNEAFDKDEEERAIESFLATPCQCGQNCQEQLSAEEIRDARAVVRLLSSKERNSLLLGQLWSFLRHSEFTVSARTKGLRKRQKFEYRINADRRVCRDVFLFYNGETPKRLKRLQKHLIENGTLPPVHGNVGRKPAHACSEQNRAMVKSFIVNYAANHGLPDPGRDLRSGKGRLRILLPSVMTYMSVHRVYEKSLRADSMTVEPVGRHTFARIWQEEVPHIVFNDPRTDLCMTCEGFKKQLNQVTATHDEQRDAKKAEVHQQALDHLQQACRERVYYRACAKISREHYDHLAGLGNQTPCKANSRDILMHYSFDFAQQFHYPFEDQQVGPIYFKTPRRAQLFGVCIEGIPRQVNYLIDEADFLAKSPNTVISLLDHFFANHSLGEKTVHLTADNCVAQNKNNAMLHYLMYRVLTGLHTNIELSFLVVGHTKFSPDGFFGLIRRRYRRSQVYTYEHLAQVIEDSSPKGHNLCQRYTTKGPKSSRIIYRDWAGWLARYFNPVPGITGYRHFHISASNRGRVLVKETVDGEEQEIALIKRDFPYSPTKRPARLPKELKPDGLSIDRQKYLYEQIRPHIPSENDKNATCPKPTANMR